MALANQIDYKKSIKANKKAEDMEYANRIHQYVILEIIVG